MGFFAEIEEAARQEARQGRRENTEPHQPEEQEKIGKRAAHCPKTLLKNWHFAVFV